MRFLKIVSLLIILVTASTLGFAKVRVDYDHSANFSNYRTFMWQEKPQTDDPFMADRIMDAVNAQLIARGLEPVRANADLCITATSDTQQVPIVSTYYSGFGGWGWAGWGGAWGGPAWATTTVDYDLKAELTVTIIDASSAQAVWRGVSYGDISSKPEKASKKTAKNIGKMFEEYPPVTLFRD